MALTDVTTTFDLNQILGGDFEGPVRAHVVTNADDDTLMDTSTGETRLGSQSVDVAADGTGSWTSWAPGPDGNPASWQETLIVSYRDAATRARKIRSFGPYTITTSGLLTDLEEEQAVPPTYLSTVTAQLDTYVTEAETARDETQALRDGIVGDLGTTDSQTATLINSPGSLTETALTASIEDTDGPLRVGAARTFARGLSLTQPEFGAEVGTVATHQAAFESALAAATSAGVSLHIPGGEWTVDNLAVVTNSVIKGDGIQNTRIRRSADTPALKARGAAYSGSGAFFPSIFGVTIQDVTIYNPLDGATTPLVDLAGVSALNMDRVQFESYQDGPSVMRLAQVWDSQFNECLFASGGNSAGTNPVVELVAGFVDGATTYRQTKEIVFHNCHWEDYFGAALAATRPEGYTDSKVEIVKFSGRSKMESMRSTVPHMSLTANHLDFGDHYVRHWLNAGAVVDLVNVRGAKGSLRFFGGNSGTYTKPSARLNVPAISQFIGIAVQVAEPQASDENVLTLATPGDSTNRLRLNAPYPLINGVTTLNKIQAGQYWFFVTAGGTVRRSLGYPTSDTSGSVVGPPNASTPDLNDAASTINTVDKYQGKQVFCTTLAKPVWTNGATAGEPWRDAAGVVTHTPV